jgi:hypothetical protein
MLITFARVRAGVPGVSMRRVEVNGGQGRSSSTHSTG